mmetsp:Transcript_129078/g.223070  ORF Transcript_129078/g.223070 Transcript_129078/m.223070 type:complete len:217 (+) Transcript_129078:745-1395(+)
MTVCCVSSSNEPWVCSPVSAALEDPSEVISTIAPSWRRARVMRAMLRASSMPECTFPSGLTPSVCIIRISPTGFRFICCENVCLMSTHWLKTGGTSISESLDCLGSIDFRSQSPSQTNAMRVLSPASITPWPLSHAMTWAIAVSKSGAVSTCSCVMPVKYVQKSVRDVWTWGLTKVRNSSTTFPDAASMRTTGNSMISMGLNPVRSSHVASKSRTA